MAGDLVGSGEAARALGISARTLARWVQEGQITPTSITSGGHFRFDLDDLKAQLVAIAARNRDAR